MQLDNVDLHKLADLSDGYVGADIEAVCREAAIMALRHDIKADKVKFEHFQEALKKVHPSVNDEIKNAYINLEAQFRQARGKEVKNVVNYMG